MTQGFPVATPPVAGIIYYQPDERSIRRLDVERGLSEPFLQSEEQGSSLRDVTFTADGSGFAYLRGTLHYASVEHPTSATQIAQTSEVSKVLGWSTDGQRLYYLRADQTLCSWNRLTHAKRELRKFNHGASQYGTIYGSWTHAGDAYVIKEKPGSRSHDVFEYETGRLIGRYRERLLTDFKTNSLGVSPNGRQLVLCRKRYSWPGYVTGLFTIPVATLWDFMPDGAIGDSGPRVLLVPIFFPVGAFGKLSQYIFTEPFAEYKLVIHDLAAKRDVFTVQPVMSTQPGKLVWSPNGQRFVALNNNLNTMPWMVMVDMAQKRRLGFFWLPTSAVDATWSHDGQWVGVIGSEHEIDPQTRRRMLYQCWVKAYNIDGVHCTKIMHEGISGYSFDLAIHGWAKP